MAVNSKWFTVYTMYNMLYIKCKSPSSRDTSNYVGILPFTTVGLAPDWRVDWMTDDPIRDNSATLWDIMEGQADIDLIQPLLRLWLRLPSAHFVNSIMSILYYSLWKIQTFLWMSKEKRIFIMWWIDFYSVIKHHPSWRPSYETYEQTTIPY